MNHRGRPRGRPPGRRGSRNTSSNKTTASSRGQATRPTRDPRTRVRTCPSPRTLDRAMTLPEIPESQSPERTDTTLDPSSRISRYQLSTNRAPRYKCGTCGSRNCSCVERLASEPPYQRLARGADIPARELLLAKAPHHPQHEALAVEAQRGKLESAPSIQHIVIIVEKTYASVEPGVVPPLNFTLTAMHATSPSDCPSYRFKEWMSHDRGGLEFTLSAVIPPLPPSMTFGELDTKSDSLEMVRCITAHQLWEKYRVASPPGRRISTHPPMVVTRHFPQRNNIGIAHYAIHVSGELTHHSRARRHPLLPPG